MILIDSKTTILGLERFVTISDFASGEGIQSLLPWGNLKLFFSHGIAPRLRRMWDKTNSVWKQEKFCHLMCVN